MKALPTKKRHEAQQEGNRIFSGRGTEGIRGLGDSWDAISLASYFLTADRGLQVGDTTSEFVKSQGTAEVICMRSNGMLNVRLDET